MYCVKCGVELADSERVCPLCETPVYFPDLDPDPETPYPREINRRDFNPRYAVCFLITCFYLIIAAIPLLCDLNINDRVTWSFKTVKCSWYFIPVSGSQLMPYFSPKRREAAFLMMA